MAEPIPTTCEEIAIQYAGRDIELYCEPPDRSIRIIGYYKYSSCQYVVVEMLNDGVLGLGSEESIFSGHLIKTAERLLSKNTLYYYGVHQVKRILPIFKPSPLYTNKCGICSSPSRNNKAASICSNVKCKSWRKIRMEASRLNKARPKYKLAMCPECGKAANYGSSNSSGTALMFECSYYGGHRWKLDVAPIAVKDIYGLLGWNVDVMGWVRIGDDDVK